MAYEIVGLLGRGGSAVVELAVDADGRSVATKRLALHGSAEQIRVARARLRREAEVLGRLHHPGIVPLLDLVEAGDDVILVLPALVESLEDRVDRLGPLPPDEVARIGARLIEALSVAHRAGVIHRDIKPSNILFDGDGRAALADFGVAATREATAGLTRPGAAVGTPTWMAPEQTRGDPAGPASDVYALATTLVFAATGVAPDLFGPPGRAGRSAGRRALAGLPGRLRDPLRRMLDPRPDRRPSAAAVLGGLEGTPLEPPDPGHRSGPPAVRRVTAMASGAARRVVRVVDGAPPTTRTRGRRIAGIVAAASGLIAGGLVLGLTAGGPGPRPDRRATAPAPGSPTTTCTPLRYRPCGAAIAAPHTKGVGCEPGWYDLDDAPADGCEARSDYRPGTRLTTATPVRANLVPDSSTDTFTTHVSGHALHLCWGSLHVTLTAPARAAERLTLWRGTTRVAQVVSVDGAPATATMHKPSCFGADSTDLRMTVASVASGPGATAPDFTLTRDGGW